MSHFYYHLMEIVFPFGLSSDASDATDKSMAGARHQSSGTVMRRQQMAHSSSHIPLPEYRI